MKPLTYSEKLSKKIASDQRARTKYLAKPKKAPVRLKTARTATKKRKPKNPLKQAKGKLWELTKALVRRRQVKPDGTWDCYTCGMRIENPKDAHTAHFVPSSVCGASLRYSLDNLRVCCGKCNVWLSGNWTCYYEHLLEEVGPEEVTRIMNQRHLIVKADIHFYNRLIAEYEELLK